MAKHSYDSPDDFYVALKNKARFLAARTGRDVADLMKAYFSSRLVARLFHAEADEWMIKGNLSLLIRYPEAARIGRNINIQHASYRDVNKAVQALKAAAALELDDYMSFEPLQLTTHEGGHRKGARQLFKARIGNQTVAQLWVGVVAVGPAVIGVPSKCRLEPILELSRRPVSRPEVQLFPITDQLAEQVCAFYEKHHGKPSSRNHDLPDILLIGRHEPVDGLLAHTAIHAQARHRFFAGVDIELPRAFDISDELWRSKFPDAASAAPGLEGTTWDQANAAGNAFLTPLLDRKPPKLGWSPNESLWNRHSQVQPGTDRSGLQQSASARQALRHPACPPTPRGRGLR